MDLSGAPRHLVTDGDPGHRFDDPPQTASGAVDGERANPSRTAASEAVGNSSAFAGRKRSSRMAAAAGR